MPMSTSPLSYAHVRGVMDQALNSEKGVRLRCDTRGEALNKRQQCYSYRVMDRRDNARTYSDDHPLFNRSEYDRLVITVEEDQGQIWLRIERSRPEALEERMEEL